MSSQTDMGTPLGAPKHRPATGRQATRCGISELLRARSEGGTLAGGAVAAYQESLELGTPGRGFVDVTEELVRVVERSGVHTGLCTVFVQHTSASLVVQENADPAVLRDLARWMSELASESRRWEHDAEGPDDMPAHARSALTRTAETIPVTGGRLALGTWQAVYLWEHRSRPHRRRLIVHVAGE